MIGAHASISPKIINGLKYMKSIGATAVQIFTGSNQSASLASKQQLTLEDKKEIKSYVKAKELYLAIHAIYLLNLCSFPPTSNRIQYALKNLIYDLETGEEIGAKTVVVHIGYKKELTTEEAYDNMAENIIAVLLKTNDTAPSVSLSLETPAGQGTQIATTLPELSKLVNLCTAKIKLLKEKGEITASTARLTDKRLTICIDTAHIFSAGTDIRTMNNFKEYFNNIKKEFGKRIAIVHLNDSKQPLNSRKDQHEGIGDGKIFGNPESYKSLQYLVKWSSKNAIPIILETHKAGGPQNMNSDLYAQEIAFLNNLLNNELLESKMKKWKLKHTRKTAKNMDSINLIKKENLRLLEKIMKLKEYYTIVEKDSIRARAYNNAYLVLLNYPEEIKSGEQVAHLPGIGKKMVAKINQFIEKGEFDIFKAKSINSILKTKKRQIAEQASSKLEILGFGPKRLRNLAASGYTTVAKIRKGVALGEITLSTTEEIGLTYYEDLKLKMSRKESGALYKFIESRIKKSGILEEYDSTIEIAGSYPSGKKASKDLDILIFTGRYKTPTSIPKVILAKIAELFRQPDEMQIYSIGNTKLMMVVKHVNKWRHVDIRLLPKSSEVAGRLYFTSGRDFNVMIRQYAIRKGYMLNEYGLYIRDSKKKIDLSTEEELFQILDLDYIPLNKRRALNRITTYNSTK